MTQILASHSAQVQEMRNMNLVTQEALRETTAARKQLSGLKQLTNELHQTQRDVLHYKERANQYELGLLRTEAHLKKTKNALWEKQMENMGLKDRVKSFEEGRQGKIRRKMVMHRHEGVLTDMADGSELEVDSAPFVEDEEAYGGHWKQHQSIVQNKKEIVTRDMAIQVIPSPDDIASSVPKQRHDNVLRDNVRLQFVVQDLSKKEGLHFKKVLQQSEYEDQIAQLREELQVRSEELQQLKREIQQAKTGKDVGSKLLETGLQLEKVSKANEMKQVINETLSRHVETLAKALKDAKMELAYEKRHNAGPVARAEKETNTDHEIVQATGGDEPDGKAVAKRPTPKDIIKPQLTHPTDDSKTTVLDTETESKTTERPQWEQKELVEKFQQQVKHLEEKTDKLTQDCKKLLTDKVMAIRDREVYATRYNDLMETVKQSPNKSPTACYKCREHEKMIKKIQEEMQNMKSEIEMVTAQKKMFEEDLEQEQLDAQQDKEKYKSQIESWRKNCVTLGKQVNLLGGDLEKERKKIQTLEQRLSLQQQATQVIQAVRARQSQQYSTMQPYQGLCATEVQPAINPFQAGYVPRPAGILATDGEDDYDGPPQDYKSALDTFQSAAGQKNECPRCKREFEPNEQVEFQRHVDKCLDSS